MMRDTELMLEDFAALLGFVLIVTLVILIVIGIVVWMVVL
jgi:hypothetical protein